MSFRPLFIASLGNPPSVYKNTFHSAGHTLVFALHRHLTFPPFTKTRLYANGLLSKAEDFTFWQSPSLMNVSGPAVAIAWKAFLRELPQDLRSKAKLVVVHDQLELPFGKIKIKHGGSHKGHNGLKSCIQSLGGMSFSRIEVGIGRPESRENKDVAAYVMKKMGNAELQKIENAIDEVMDALVEMRDS